MLPPVGAYRLSSAFPSKVVFLGQGAGIRFPDALSPFWLVSVTTLKPEYDTPALFLPRLCSLTASAKWDNARSVLNRLRLLDVPLESPLNSPGHFFLRGTPAHLLQGGKYMHRLLRCYRP